MSLYGVVSFITSTGEQSNVFSVLVGKGKVIPLQARCGPEGG